MPQVKLLCLCGALLSLTGCAGVVSLHPLAVPNGKDTVFDPSLLGAWEEVKVKPGGPRTIYTVTRAESGYSVNVAAGSEKLHGTMHLMKVGDRFLLDVLCPSDGAPPPVHLFLKLRLEKDTAWVREMDSGWLRDQIEANTQLRHEFTEDGRIVLVASTAMLRRQLLPYAGDDRSFGEETELRRAK